MMIETLNRTVKELGAAYFGRPSGSYIQDANGERVAGQTFVDLLETCIKAERFEDVTEEIPAYAKSSGCKYYRFEIPEDFEAYQGAGILGRLDVDLDGLRVQEASHKNHDGSPIPEIVTSEIKPLRVDFGHFIVGEHKGEECSCCLFGDDVCLCTHEKGDALKGRRAGQVARGGVTKTYGPHRFRS